MGLRLDRRRVAVGLSRQSVDPARQRLILVSPSLGLRLDSRSGAVGLSLQHINPARQGPITIGTGLPLRLNRRLIAADPRAKRA